MLEHYRDLAEQLAAMPGGHARLREEYFGSVTLPGPVSDSIWPSGEIVEGWILQGEGTLALAKAENGEPRLMWLRRNRDVEIIAAFPAELHTAAHEFSITPLGLALLTLAMGSVDDSRLKTLLPELHKASKGLLLIAVCRLCG